MEAGSPSFAGAYMAFRFAYVGLGLLGAWALWRRPRPGAAVALVVLLNLAAWAAYVAPLGRPYAFGEPSDRSISMGNAATVATGNSPFEHVQVRFGNLEPFWSVAAAAIALFRPRWVYATYGLLSPLAIILVSVSLYRGLRVDDSEADRWERALVVLAVLGLSSFSMSQDTPVPALWAGNLLLKPNHAMGWGLLGVVVGMRTRGSPPWRLGLVLGVLAWAYLLGWVYLIAGLAVGALLLRQDRAVKGLALAVALSVLIAAPYLAHLARDYNPLRSEPASTQLWREQLGRELALPHWVTLDLGPLLLLGAAGAVVLWRRRSRRDVHLLGILAAAWTLWTVWAIVAVVMGGAPEPDEIYYFLRVCMAVAAGSALAALARYLERTRGLGAGRGHLVALAAALPLTFPAYWNPPTMDRYFNWCLAPVRPKVEAYGAWVRDNTPCDAVFLAGGEASTWIPALAGRRVLLLGAARPPADYAERKEVERVMLASRDPALILAAARRYGIGFVAIDDPMTKEYGAETLAGLGRLPVYEPVYASSAVRILRVRAD